MDPAADKEETIRVYHNILRKGSVSPSCVLRVFLFFYLLGGRVLILCVCVCAFFDCSPLDYDNFCKAVKHRYFLSALVGSYDTNTNFTIPSDYDYTKPTFENYRNPNPAEFVGEYAKFREKVRLLVSTNLSPIWRPFS